MEPLHIKLETGEILNSKRHLLSAQINLLNIAKKIENYRTFRKLELRTKTLLRTEMKKTNENMKNMEKLLPKAKIPEKEAVLEKTKTSSLEKELEKIKEELARLG
jgi:hypothetical protein